MICDEINPVELQERAGRERVNNPIQMGFADLSFGQCLGRREERDKSTQRNLQRVRTSAFLCERRGSSGAKSEEAVGRGRAGPPSTGGNLGTWVYGPQWSDLVSQ